MYNRAKQLYCRANILICFSILHCLLLQKMKTEKWPKVADFPLYKNVYASECEEVNKSATRKTSAGGAFHRDCNEEEADEKAREEIRSSATADSE